MIRAEPFNRFPASGAFAIKEAAKFLPLLRGIVSGSRLAPVPNPVGDGFGTLAVVGSPFYSGWIHSNKKGGDSKNLRRLSVERC